MAASRPSKSTSMLLYFDEIAIELFFPFNMSFRIGEQEGVRAVSPAVSEEGIGLYLYLGKDDFARKRGYELGRTSVPFTRKVCPASREAPSRNY